MSDVLPSAVPADLAPSAEGDLGFLLRQAAGAHRIRMDRALAELGLTAPQLLVLTLVAAHPGCSGADLARRALLTTPTVSVIVTRLLNVGLLSRRAHATHGRIRHLELTPMGAALLKRCQALAAPVEADLRRGMSEDDAARVRAWLIAATGAAAA